MTALTSEDSILAVIERHFPRGHSRLLMGRGDDCCVLVPEDSLAISTDLFMEDVHFRRSYFSSEDIGWKALAVNISGIAACGAKPVGFSLGLALPPDADMELVDGLFTGMAGLAGPLNLALTGGDLSRADKLHLCITVFGDVTADRMLRRANCLPGDTLFLIGQTGLARTGLLALEAHGTSAFQDYPRSCMAHVRPVPRTREGLMLADLRHRTGGRIALMDLSDGPARDIPRLLGTYGATLTLPAPHPEILAAAQKNCKGDTYWAKAMECCWTGGEDYALLGTCEPQLVSELLSTVSDVQILGTVTEGPLIWNGHTVSGTSGFDHFASS